MKLITLTFCVVGLSACSWVSPSLNSQEVALVKPVVVQGCEKLGETTSKTLSKISIIPRSKKKVSTELITLAKNEAAIMGGDTITATEYGENGVQVFEVYRCRSAY